MEKIAKFGVIKERTLCGKFGYTFEVLWNIFVQGYTLPVSVIILLNLSEIFDNTDRASYLQNDKIKITTIWKWWTAAKHYKQMNEMFDYKFVSLEFGLILDSFPTSVFSSVFSAVFLPSITGPTFNVSGSTP